MTYPGPPHCAFPGCMKMPMVQVYGFRHNEYEDFCEEHHTYRLPPAVTEWSVLEQRLAAIEQRLSALEAREA